MLFFHKGLFSSTFHSNWICFCWWKFEAPKKKASFKRAFALGCLFGHELIFVYIRYVRLFFLNHPLHRNANKTQTYEVAPEYRPSPIRGRIKPENLILKAISYGISSDIGREITTEKLTSSSGLYSKKCDTRLNKQREKAKSITFKLKPKFTHGTSKTSPEVEINNKQVIQKIRICIIHSNITHFSYIKMK